MAKRHFTILGTCGLVLLATQARATTTLNFDTLTATSAYSNGVLIPANARLSTQYLASNGILFSSNGGFVGVGNYSSAAPSSPNGIGGSSPDGKFDYAAPVTFSFWDPTNTSTPAVTSFFAFTGDLDPSGGGVNVTVSAYGIDGALLGTSTRVDNGGETWVLSFPGIHTVVYPGTSANPSSGGIALDDVTFSAVTVPVPEPTTALSISTGLFALLLKRRAKPV